MGHSAINRNLHQLSQAALVCFILDRNQSDHHKPVYYVFWGHTRCAHTQVYALTSSHIQTQRESLKTTCRLPLDVFLMANKVQRQKGIIWQKRLWKPCTFDTSEWGSVIEAFFEDKGRTIIKACCWNNRGILAQDVLPDWKQIGFIVNVTSHDLIYLEAHVVFDFWVYAQTQTAFISKKFVFPNCSNVVL